MLHDLAVVIAWIVGVAIVGGLVVFLLRLLRVILGDSVGKPLLRAAMLFGLAFGLFVFWSVSRVVP